MRPRAVSRVGRLGSLALGMVLGAGAMFAGLAQADRIAPAQPDVLVALGQRLDVEHRAVDLKVENGDIAGAIASLESLRAGPWPGPQDASPTATALRHDAYGRLIRLRLDHPEVDPVSNEALLERIDEGLGEDEPDANPFTARLWALRGELYENEGRDDEALAAYERALEINSILLERELGGAP
jgi:cytochrome c-type biogenesis protein CcmH/NrfG